MEMPVPRPAAPAEHPALQGMRVVRVGIFINAALALLKGAAGVFGNSYALIADAIESGADVFTSLVVLYGLSVAARPPDTDHPHGHGKAEPLAALVVPVALLAAAAFIAVESVYRIVTPHKAPAPFTLAVLVVVVAIKETLARTVQKAGEAAGSGAVKGDAFHHRADAITASAAFVGISVALIGGKGWESADDWAALFAAGVIVVNAVVIARGALGELMDSAPDASIEAGIRRVAGVIPGVVGLHHCTVRKSGFDFYADLDVIVDREMSVLQAHQIAHDVQDAARSDNPRLLRVVVHIEPSGEPHRTA